MYTINFAKRVDEQLGQLCTNCLIKIEPMDACQPLYYADACGEKTKLMWPRYWSLYEYNTDLTSIFLTK